MPKKKAINPFYVLLVLLGVVFFVTACAYGVMAISDLRSSAYYTQPETAHPLMELMRERGGSILLVELVLLTLCTFGAIGTDQYWTGRNDE